MKKTAYILLILLSSISTNLFSQTPVVYYPLNGNAIDSSGKGLHGRMENCTPIPDRFGRPNGAIQLDNIVNVKNSKITFPTPDITGFYSDVFTYSLWVKVPNFLSLVQEANNTIFFMGNVGDSYHQITVNNSGSISTRGFGSGTSNLTNDILKAHSYCSQMAKVDTTKWYHLVLVRDTGNTRFYVNGSLKSSTTVHSLKPKYTKGDSTASFNLYKIFGDYTVFVDELRIYDKVLTTAQIAALYTPAPANSGINNISEESKFRIYPNPSKGNMQLDYEMFVNDELANVTIYDLDGRELISNRNVLPQENIDISNLSRGLYFVYIKYNEQTITKKIVVE